MAPLGTFRLQSSPSSNLWETLFCVAYNWHWLNCITYHAHDHYHRHRKSTIFWLTRPSFVISYERMKLADDCKLLCHRGTPTSWGRDVGLSSYVGALWFKSHWEGYTSTCNPSVQQLESRFFSKGQSSLSCDLRVASNTFDINTPGWINVSNTFGGGRSQTPLPSKLPARLYSALFNQRVQHKLDCTTHCTTQAQPSHRPIVTSLWLDSPLRVSVRCHSGVPVVQVQVQVQVRCHSGAAGPKAADGRVTRTMLPAWWHTGAAVLQYLLLVPL